MRAFRYLAIAAVALAALPANALTITQTTGVSGGLPFATTPVAFDKFNTPGQVLQSVTLSFETSGGGSATITAGRFGATGIVSNAQTVSITGNGFALSDRGTGPVQGVLLGSRAVQTYFFSPATSDSDTLTGDLSAFLGPGTLSFDFSIIDSSLDLVIGETSTVRDQIFGTSINLTYETVAAVPEPGTWGMLILSRNCRLDQRMLV